MRPPGRARSLQLVALVLTACTSPVATAEPPATTVKTTLTETATQQPADAGTIETALGTFSWQHLTGDAGALPYHDPWVGDLVGTPSGYEAIEHLRNPHSNVLTRLQYWHSPDGYEWIPKTSPVPVEAEDGARLQELADGYWLTTWNPATLWRSDDGETWLEVPLPEGVEPGLEPLHEMAGTIWLTSRNPPPNVWRLDDGSWTRIDTNALTPPDITGVEWTLESWNWLMKGGPATVGEVTLFPWDLNASVDYQALGFGDLYAFWDLATRTIVLHDDERITVATLSVEAEGNRFIFSDEAGTVVHEITNNDNRLDAATLLDSLGGFRQLSLGVLDHEGRITASIPPWGGFGAGGDVALLGVDDRFLAFIQRYDQTGRLTVQLWTSADGLSWSGPQRPGFMPEVGDIDYLTSVRAEGDVVLAEFGVGGHTEVWASDNGISWTDTGLKLNNQSMIQSLVPFGSGGIYAGTSATAYEMFVSTDLRTWERVDTLQLGMTTFPANSGRVLSIRAVGDLIFLSIPADATGTRDMWVLELDR